MVMRGKSSLPNIGAQKVTGWATKQMYSPSVPLSHKYITHAYMRRIRVLATSTRTFAQRQPEML